MLRDLRVDQARVIADLAKTARAQRDALFDNVPEDDLDGSTPGRGEHNPSAELGPESVPPVISRAVAALREAVTSLSESARRELYTLIRIGQGDLAVKSWDRGLSDAEMLGDGAITSAIVDDPDLHDHIAKSLYEARLAG